MSAAPAWLQKALLHEDKAVLAFNKPAGLASQGGRGQTQDLESLLASFAVSPKRRPHLAHRLDAETSGVIVAGRTKAAIAHLNAAFANRQAQKTYLAILCGGEPEPPTGSIAVPLQKIHILRQALMRPARPEATGAMSALTHYETLAAVPAAALVRLRPQTGRMHQLRVHSAALGRPIAGDQRYGGLSTLGGHAVPGLMLHAARLVCPHPLGGMLDICAPPPAAFTLLAGALGLAQALEEAWT